MKTYLRQIVSIILILIVMISCSDMGEPEVLIPHVDHDPSVIIFSTITIGTNQSRELTIINSGEGLLDIILDLVQDNMAYSLDVAGAFSLHSGDTLRSQLIFHPNAAAIYTAQIIIGTNDPETPEILIEVTGQGTTELVPVLSVSAAQIDFGTVYGDDSVQRQFILSSTGTDTLVIDSIRFGLDVYRTDEVLPIILLPGASQVISVIFHPGGIGTFNTSMTIYSNSPDTPRTIDLTGSAENQISYAASVQPVWNANCTGCHGTSGGLNLTSYGQLMSGGNSGSVVIPGNGASSRVIQKLMGTASGSQMPLGGPFLSAETIGLIETWIDQGALNN